LDPPRWRWADVDEWMSNPASRDSILRRYQGEGAGIEVANGDEPPHDRFAAAAGKFRHGKKDRARGSAV
jgi:hypothetical protein